MIPKITTKAPISQGTHLPIPPPAVLAACAAEAPAAEAPAPTELAAAPTDDAAADAAAMPVPATAAPPATSPPSKDWPLPISADTSAGKAAGTAPPGVRRETSIGSKLPTAEVTASRGKCSLSLRVASKPPEAPNSDSTWSLLGACGGVAVPNQLAAISPKPALRTRSSRPESPPLAGSVIYASTMAIRSLDLSPRP